MVYLPDILYVAAVRYDQINIGSLGRTRLFTRSRVHSSIAVVRFTLVILSRRRQSDKTILVFGLYRMLLPAGTVASYTTILPDIRAYFSSSKYLALWASALMKFEKLWKPLSTSHSMYLPLRFLLRDIYDKIPSREMTEQELEQLLHARVYRRRGMSSTQNTILRGR